MAIAALRSYLARRLKKWWELEWMPWLDWIQIEVTSRCNAACAYCPRTVYHSQWASRDLSLDTFERLRPVFAKTKMVHLQGWGEPLLHRDFFEMVARAKKTGCKVGTTTNGILLDRQEISRLIKSNIDHVTFSLTGICENNDTVRKGTDFRKILQAISDLAAQKKALHVETPMVNVAYLLLRSHLSDIDDIVPMLAGLGIQHVIISTLDFVPSKDLQKEQLMPCDEREYRELKSFLDRLVMAGKQAGLSISYRLVSPGKRNRNCTENIERSLFVSADGTVSPCVFTNIPAFEALHMIRGCEHEYRQLTFGTVVETSMPAIWLSRRYTTFRDSFDSTLHPFCQECPKLYES
jgi:MoaA/NifB/PqqE/SkfB family radical SAM enzyme